MNLSERKKKILSAVVDESIKTAEPVSSKEVQEKYMSEFSPATIRNELMALEEMGFLSQPHTSSGRVPTAEGYKMYVEELMQLKKLSKKESEQIKESFNDKLVNIDDILQKTAKTISDVTNYASIVYYGISDIAIVDKILLIPVSSKSTLIVVSTDLGIIKQESNLVRGSEDDLRQASKILTKVFNGKKLEEVKSGSTLLTDELIRYKDIFYAIIQILTERDTNFAKNVVVSGKEKLLNYPEYHDIDKLKKAFSIFDNHQALYPLISGNENLEISVKVGGDQDSGLTDCSIISATYKLNGKQVGSTSVVGPVRMDYGKVISILKNVTDLLEHSILDNKGDQNE